MKKLFYSLLVLASVFLYSCENTMDEQMSLNPQQPQAKISVIQTPEAITTDVAAHVATLFNGQNAQTKSIKSIKEIIPLAGEDGNPALYVVNYTDNQGYVIISANNQYQPIIAYNETGNYDIHAQDGSSVLLDEHLYTLQHIDALPDSVQLAFKRQWNQFFMSEEPLALSTTETKASGETFEEEQFRVGVYIETTLNEWSNEGYMIYTYESSKSDFFTSSEIQQIDNYLAMHADDRYFGGFENTVYIRIKSETSNASVSPLVSTNWNQIDGYAAYTPNNWPTGCDAVTLGQIMKYHEFPIVYDWDAMAETYATNKTAAFLAELGSEMGANYGATSTTTTTSAAHQVLKEYGYQNCRIDNSANVYTCRQQLDNQWPVYMRGNNNNDEGHSWVSDGYNYSETTQYCEVMALDKEEMYHTDEPLFRQMYYKAISNISLSFHMNWGWGGYNNGYWNINSTEDFPNNRKNIVDIYPVQ